MGEFVTHGAATAQQRWRVIPTRGDLPEVAQPGDVRQVLDDGDGRPAQYAWSHGEQTWIKQSDPDGATPVGPAGGDLEGDYPNPTVVAGSDRSAVHTNKSSEYTGTELKLVPDADDRILIEDRSEGNAKRQVTVESLRSHSSAPTGPAGGGLQGLYPNPEVRIGLLDEVTTASRRDILLIEKDSNSAKRRISLGDLPLWIPYRIVSNADSPVNLADTDGLLVIDRLAGPVTVTLPVPDAGSGFEGGRMFYIKSGAGAGGSPLVLETDSPTTTVDGQSSVTFNYAWQSFAVFCDGSNWLII